MLQTRCVKIRLKPGMVTRTREWAAEINRRRDEANASIRSESVVIGCAFLDSTADGEFLIYFMKGKDLSAAKSPVHPASSSIDGYHQMFKAEAWENGTRLEPLIELDLTEELGGNK